MNKLPNSWNEVNVELFSQLKLMNETNPNFFIRQIELFSLLTDTYPEDEMWFEMNIEDLITKINKLTWLRIEPTTNYKKEIDVYKSIDLNNLTLGEFIDLEYYFTNNLYENLGKILATIYRKHKLNEFGNVEIEPLGSYNLNERLDYFNSIPITWVYGLLYEFLTFKTNLFNTYKVLFQDTLSPEELAEIEQFEDEYPLDPEEAEAERLEKLNQKWSWENLIYKISNGDVTKYEEILNLPTIFVFNQLSFMKDLNK